MSAGAGPKKDCAAASTWTCQRPRPGASAGAAPTESADASPGRDPIPAETVLGDAGEVDDVSGAAGARDEGEVGDAGESGVADMDDAGESPPADS
jgi:hypothetical protein